MAFSLQGFGAGFASKLTDRLDEERTRQERLQDEATSIATRQRLAKQAKRDEEKLIIEEQATFLKSLGWGEKEIAQAMKGGKKGLALYEQVGTKAFEMGVNPNDLLSYNDTPEITNGVLSDAAGPKPKTNTLNSYSWNTDAVKALYGEVEDEEVSLDMQLANNVSRQSKLLFSPQTPDTAKKLTALQEQEAFLLKQHAKLAAAKREEKPESKITVTEFSTLEQLISKNHALETKKVGLGYDVETKLEIAFEGNQGKGYSALLESVYKMENSIGQNGDDFVNTRLQQERNSIERGLQRHAMSEINKKDEQGNLTVKTFKTGPELESAIARDEIKIGQPVFVGNNFFVYTGVPSAVPAFKKIVPLLQFNYTQREQ